MNEISIARLRQLFTVNPDGLLIWRVAHGSVKVGDEAGRATPRGYRRVSVANKEYQVHRIVFAMTHGRWPTDQIDHINGVKNDNRPCNLREATNTQNKINIPVQANNKVGMKGVCRHSRGRKYMAQITIDGKHKYLGLFQTAEAASAAYQAAATKHYGEFAYRPLESAPLA